MKIPQNIKEMVESLRCPKHHKTPQIMIDNEDHLKIECCCADFKKQCLYLIGKMMLISYME